MEARTLSGAYDKISSHEELCAERYERIDEKLIAQGKQLSTINRTALGLLLALLAWMATQLYGLEPLRHVGQTDPSGLHAEMPRG